MSAGIEEALAMVAGEDLAHRIIGALDRIEVAEEEIKKAQQLYPAKEQEIWNSFTFLRPTEELMLQNEIIYRSHARELVDRAGLGMDLNEATNAELLCVMVRRSLMALPGHDERVLFFRLFHEVMGDEMAMKIDQREMRESYPNAALEIDHKLRRSIRKEDRGE